MMSMRLAMEIFISPRICRTPSISCLTHSMSPSALASMRLSFATGQACSMMVVAADASLGLDALPDFFGDEGA